MARKRKKGGKPQVAAEEHSTPREVGSDSACPHVDDDRVDVWSEVHEILRDSYDRASGNGRFTITMGQFYHAVPEEFHRSMEYARDVDVFAYKILGDYMNGHPDKTSNWRIAPSRRGTLTLPNSAVELSIPWDAGVEAVDTTRRGRPWLADLGAALPVEWRRFEDQRVQAVLLVQGAAFDPQLREAQIAKRFNLAVLCCDYASISAARVYLHRMCAGNDGVPLIVAHDLDFTAFAMCRRLTSDLAQPHSTVNDEGVDRGRFTDLGLRLTDAIEYGLAPEHAYGEDDDDDDLDPFDLLIGTPEEQALFQDYRCVVLSAFTAPQFLAWLVARLERAGLTDRLITIPDDGVLEDAYRYARAIRKIQSMIRTASPAAIAEAMAVPIPADLRAQLTRVIAETGRPWDIAMTEVVAGDAGE